MKTAESPEFDNDVEDSPIDDEEFIDHRNRVFLALAWIGGFGYLGWMAYNMPVGEATDPGPGFFPLAVSIVGFVSSLLVFLESSFKLKRQGQGRGPDRTSKSVWIFVGLLVLFAALLPMLGFYIGAVLFGISSVRVIGGISWAKSSLYGALIGAITAALAIELLGIRVQAWPWS